jgi:hypothetical protein
MLVSLSLLFPHAPGDVLAVSNELTAPRRAVEQGRQRRTDPTHTSHDIDRSTVRTRGPRSRSVGTTFRRSSLLLLLLLLLAAAAASGVTRLQPLQNLAHK